MCFCQHCTLPAEVANVEKELRSAPFEAINLALAVSRRRQTLALLAAEDRLISDVAHGRIEKLKYLVSIFCWRGENALSVTLGTLASTSGQYPTVSSTPTQCTIFVRSQAGILPQKDQYRIGKHMQGKLSPSHRRQTSSFGSAGAMVSKPPQPRFGACSGSGAQAGQC